MSDEFYIGYEPQMPPGHASRIRAMARGLIAFALLLSGVLVFSQGRFSVGVFEYGHVRTFEGRVIEYPYPALEVITRLGGAETTTTTYWLVGQGKHGADDLVKNRDGRIVRLSGSLIARDEDSMIEIAPGSLVIIDAAHSSPGAPLRSLGSILIQGEIVDSKCHLGVMKPGEGPAHRDCAVRCLLGHVPPMFVPHDSTSGMRRVALVGSDRRALRPDVDLPAGKPVSVRGELFERGTQRFLAAAAADIRVLAD